jgi:hypothetical protein
MPAPEQCGIRGKRRFGFKRLRRRVARTLKSGGRLET